MPISKDLDKGYLDLLDSEFLAIHRWEPHMVEAIRTNLRATSYLRHLVTRQTAVLVRSDEPLQVLGFVSLDPLKDRPGGHYLGFQLAKEFRNKGYMTETVRSTVRYLSRSPQLDEVSIATDLDNVAVNRICEKLDFPRRTNMYEHPDGTRGECFVYQALAPRVMEGEPSDG